MNRSTHKVRNKKYEQFKMLFAQVSYSFISPTLEKKRIQLNSSTIHISCSICFVKNDF
jgi:hypothetical protein